MQANYLIQAQCLRSICSRQNPLSPGRPLFLLQLPVCIVQFYKLSSDFSMFLRNSSMADDKLQNESFGNSCNQEGIVIYSFSCCSQNLVNLEKIN